MMFPAYKKIVDLLKSNKNYDFTYSEIMEKTKTRLFTVSLVSHILEYIGFVVITSPYGKGRSRMVRVRWV